MSNFTSLISAVDTSSVEPQLYIEGKLRNKTFIGGVITILLLIVKLVFFIMFFLPVLNKTNPVVLDNMFYSNDASIHINQSFPLYFEVSGPRGEPLGEDIWNATLIYNQVNFTFLENGKPKIDNYIKYTKMIKCTPAHFGEYFHLFKDSKYFENYCIDYSATGDFSLYNPHAGNGINFSVLTFIAQKCINSTINNSTCASEEQINLRLKNYNIRITTLDYYLDYNNYNTPLVTIADPKTYAGSISAYKRVQLFYKSIIFSNDDGLVFESSENKTYHSVKESENFYDFSFKNEVAGQFAEIFVAFSSSGLHNFIQRRYLKVQEVIARLGGISTLFVLIGGYFSYFYSNFSYYQKLFPFYYQSSDDQNNYSSFVNNLNTPSLLKKKDSLSQSSLEISDKNKFHSIKENNFFNEMPKIAENKYISNNFVNKSSAVKLNRLDETKSGQKEIKKRNADTKKMSFSLKVSNDEGIIKNVLKNVFKLKLNFENLCIYYACLNKLKGVDGKIIKKIREELDVRNLLRISHEVSNLKSHLLNKNELEEFNKIGHLINLEKFKL